MTAALISVDKEKPLETFELNFNSEDSLLRFKASPLLPYKLEIFTVLALRQFIDQILKLVDRHESLPQRRFLGAANFDTLPLFNRRDI